MRSTVIRARFMLLAIPTVAVLLGGVLSPIASAANGKVQSFLDAVRNAKTIEEVGQAAKGARLTRGEIEQIQQALKGDRELARKLETLSRVSRETKGKSQPSAAQVNARMMQTQSQAVARANRAVRAQAASLKPVVGSVASKLPPVKTVSPATRVTMRGYQGPGSDAHITGHTIPARLGRQINIAGANFGTAEGRVVVLLADHMVECPVQRWRPSEIAITLPLSLGRYMGSTVAEGTVWVKLAGGELGPTAPIRLTPVVPRITSLSSREIAPTQELLIEGEGFLSHQPSGLASRGELELEFTSGGAGSNPLDYLDWHDNVIHVRLRDVSGLVEQTCRVVVTNATGQSDQVSVTFKPVLEVEEIRNAFAYSFNNLYSSSHLFDFGAFFAAFAGDREEVTVFEDIVLHNQFTVVSAHLAVDGNGAGHGATILEHPVTGSTRPRFRFVYWADGFASVHVNAYALVQGPRGVSFR